MTSRFCAQCGEGIDDGAAFCSNCGTPAPGQASESTQPESPNAPASTPPEGAPVPPPPPAVTAGSPNLPPPAGPGTSPVYTGTAGGFSVGNAFNYGWTKFQSNFGAIFGAMVLYLVVGLVLVGLFYGLMALISGLRIGALGSSCTTEYSYYGTVYESCKPNGLLSGLGAIGFFVVMGLYSVVIAAYFYLIQAGIVRGALAISYGKKIEIGLLLSRDRLGTVIITGVGVGIVSGIGYMLCWVPGLIITFFSQFFVFFIIDKRLGAVDSVKASWSFVNKNLGSLIGLYIASIIAIIIGQLLCGIGLLIAIPVVIIAQTYAYRTLQGESVAA